MLLANHKIAIYKIIEKLRRGGRGYGERERFVHRFLCYIFMLIGNSIFQSSHFFYFLFIEFIYLLTFSEFVQSLELFIPIFIFNSLFREDYILCTSPYKFFYNDKYSFIFIHLTFSINKFDSKFK